MRRIFNLVTWAIIVIVIPTFVMSSEREFEEKVQDLMLLLGSSLYPAGMMAYCYARVEKNDDFLLAGQRWNERNNKFMEAVIEDIESEGGLSGDQRRHIDRMAFQVIQNDVDGEDDRVEYCTDAAEILNRGVLDLDKWSETAPALEKLMRDRE